jgi:predicted ABC-type ATPase
MPDIFVIAGPNGAGKSTSAREMLPSFIGCIEFVNADEIARGLSAFRPETVAIAAGRVMLNRLNTLARQRVNFAFETTLASRFFCPWLKSLQSEGYKAHLIYLWLPSIDLAVERVRQRALAGGHSVPERDIRRRYERSCKNFTSLYSTFMDTWEVYDSSEIEPRLIGFGGKDELNTVLEPEQWNLLTKCLE